MKPVDAANPERSDLQVDDADPDFVAVRAALRLVVGDERDAVKALDSIQLRLNYAQVSQHSLQLAVKGYARQFKLMAAALILLALGSAANILMLRLR